MKRTARDPASFRKALGIVRDTVVLRLDDDELRLQLYASVKAVTGIVRKHVPRHSVPGRRVDCGTPEAASGVCSAGYFALLAIVNEEEVLSIHRTGTAKHICHEHGERVRGLWKLIGRGLAPRRRGRL